MASPGRSLRALLMVVVLSCISAVAPAAVRHSLLVGVSDYPALPPQRQLAGPRNDVALLADALREIGYERRHMHVLSGRPGTPDAPTREAIFRQLRRLSELAMPGDSVLLYFAGHGSRQPAPRSRLAVAGLEEIFLPSDIGAWDGKMGTVRNAITGREFGAALQAIRRRGADVFAVFDSCHAATLARGGAEQWRFVAPEDLSIPALSSPLSATRGLQSVDAVEVQAEGTGRWVAMYASQGNEVTPELAFPDGQGGSKVHGLFTRTLVGAMQREPGQSWAQLGQQVLAAYAAQQRLYPTPMWEGDGRWLSPGGGLAVPSPGTSRTTPPPATGAAGGGAAERGVRLRQVVAQLEGGALRQGLSLELLVQQGRSWRPLTTHFPPLHAGQKLLVRLRNLQARALDLTLLFVDSKQRVSTLFPAARGETNRFEAGGMLEIPLRLTAETLGIEQLVLLALDAVPGADVADFRYLASPEGDAKGAAQAGGGSMPALTGRASAAYSLSWRTVR